MRKDTRPEAPESTSDAKVMAIVKMAERRVRAQAALKAALSEPALRNVALWKVIRVVWRRFGADAAELLIERIKEGSQWKRLSDEQKVSVVDDERVIQADRATCRDITQRESLSVV